MRLIVGLGNPGRYYQHNRHNIGFICLNYFASKHGIKINKKISMSMIGTGDISGNKMILAKPQTYMNASGKSIFKLIWRYHISINNLVVIHDDLDLPFGRIRIRQGGSAAGHKGIQSIIHEMESKDFIRIRIGIGHPSSISIENEQTDVVDYVLGDFDPSEKKIVTRIRQEVHDAILCLINEGLTVAMNKFN